MGRRRHALRRIANWAGAPGIHGYRLLARKCRRAIWFILAACWLPHAAAAQMTFVADAGPHKMLGPRLAAGAVIWSHGRSLESEDSLSPTPAYIETFRSQHWDAFRLNRMTARDSLISGSHALAQLAHYLKMQAYRRVVLAGQSFGAFISLIAVEHADDVDAVIALAPAAYGSMIENPARGWLNALRLYPILEQIHSSRIMLFYFKNDIFDPGGRGLQSEEILGARLVPHLIIDRPAALETHWAGSTSAFAARFGPCIMAFVYRGAAAGPECRAQARGSSLVSATGSESENSAPMRRIGTQEERFSRVRQ